MSDVVINILININITIKIARQPTISLVDTLCYTTGGNCPKKTGVTNFYH